MLSGFEGLCFFGVSKLLFEVHGLSSGSLRRCLGVGGGSFVLGLRLGLLSGERLGMVVEIGLGGLG